ncbi:DnaJ C-terminal domain-containing protein [Actimicrobium sp. CCC2.4]|uniref:DnaJ C-terminal domain-containing protein n=1 Tax=Actimicrobium sp. CCC2.4 TaxID=3048606 RepID=UPI002AC8D511|nr:DnaJ C-terminal domain-containing protein [Actimicrobium sp. CCC2.4]MEB0136248.1 DnaJ C-terminal domain-containing protein [Actimicrobium sp. CCC2.4]WPX33593.1 DnaJ C-terminal domain-containing protein [Actimicrobium sp. CCC2.4]
MKYKDYYDTLGIERDATLDDIKKAYRKLAHQYHPDVSKDPKGEEKFKAVAEAYATLKNPEKRAEYDQLGKRSAGDNFAPPPQWQQRYGSGAEAFDDVDLSDLMGAFRSGGTGRRTRANLPEEGTDYSVNVEVTLEQIYSGAETDVSVELPEMDTHGLPHRVARTFRITVPKGATDGQRLRLAGKGGAGRHGGKTGNLYVVLAILPHPLYRLTGRDLVLDLALAPWEAVLGTTVEIPTLGGKVELNIKPGTSSGQRLRLGGRGLPAATGAAGDLFALVRIVAPKTLSPTERTLYEQLATLSDFKPRSAGYTEA